MMFIGVVLGIASNYVFYLGRRKFSWLNFFRPFCYFADRSPAAYRNARRQRTRCRANHESDRTRVPERLLLATGSQRCRNREPLRLAYFYVGFFLLFAAVSKHAEAEVPEWVPENYHQYFYRHAGRATDLAKGAEFHRCRRRANRTSLRVSRWGLKATQKCKADIPI